jgi:hypothetical protein
LKAASSVVAGGAGCGSGRKKKSGGLSKNRCSPRRASRWWRWRMGCGRGKSSSGGALRQQCGLLGARGGGAHGHGSGNQEAGVVLQRASADGGDARGRGGFGSAQLCAFCAATGAAFGPAVTIKLVMSEATPRDSGSAFHAAGGRPNTLRDFLPVTRAAPAGGGVPGRRFCGPPARRPPDRNAGRDQR